MPIEFEAAQPMSPSISSGYGAALEFDKLAPTFASMYERAGAMRQAAMEHASAASAAANAQQAEQNRFGAGLQAAMQNQGMDRQVAYTHMQNQFALQQQHAQLQAWVQGQAMTQNENLQLQRMRNAVAYVNNDPTADAETKSNTIFQLMTKINPLEAKQQATQLKMMQQQQGMQAAQLKFQTAMIGGTAAEKTKLLESRITRRDDGSEWYMGDDGKLAQVKQPVEKKDQEPFDLLKTAKAAKELAEVMHPDDEVDQVSGKSKPSADTLKNRAEMVRQVIGEERARAEPQRPYVPGDAASMSERQKQYIGELAQQKDFALSHPDLPPEQKAAIAGAADVLHAMHGKYGSFSHPAQRITPEDAAKIAAARDVVAQVPKGPPAKPFVWERPETQTPEQRKDVKDIDKLGEEVTSLSGVSEWQRGDNGRVVNEIKTLLMKYGSPQAMEKMNPAAARHVVQSLAFLHDVKAHPEKYKATSPAGDRGDSLGAAVLRGDAVTTGGVHPEVSRILGAARRGELVTLEKHFPRVARTLSRLNRGDLVTTDDLADLFQKFRERTTISD